MSGNQTGCRTEKTEKIPMEVYLCEIEYDNML